MTSRTSADTIVVGDHDRLAQFVINLVSNGLTFTPSGGRTAAQSTFSDGIGTGSRFTIRLPAVAETVHERPTPSDVVA